MRTPDQREIFAASEIARAINWDKRRVVNALSATPRSGCKIIGGNESPAYSLAILPEILLREVERVRVMCYQRTAADLLRDPHTPWRPRVPIGQVCEDDRRKAERLQGALAHALSLPTGTPLSDRARAAGAGYLREFGYTVTERRIGELLSRTIDRDRGERAWDRTELYLSDNPRRKPKVASAIPRPSFEELSAKLASLQDRQSLDPEDRAFCWRKVIEFFEARVANGVNPSRLKRELCAFLLEAMPLLGESRQAMKRNLNRKLSLAAKQGVTAIVDQRADRSGWRRRPEDWEENIEILLRETAACGGRESHAFRNCWLQQARSGECFTESFKAYFDYNPRRDKSQVPKKVRAKLRPMIAAVTPHLHGPKASRQARPSIVRDWEGLAGASYSGDDFTFNHYFFDWDEDGEYEFSGRRFNVTRGQSLLFCDEGSRLLIGYYVAPRPTYSADDICTALVGILMNEAIGLPYRRLSVERGIWKSENVRKFFEWPKLDEAFARQSIGLFGNHATTPQAKIVEKIGGRIQDIMQPAPGYAGRNERLDYFEWEDAFRKKLKKAGQPLKAEVNPADGLMSKKQFCDELERCIAVYNNEPGGGPTLKGRSPEEVWEQESHGVPHVVLPNSLRYLLSAQVSDQKVTKDGVYVRKGGIQRWYSDSGELQKCLGERVRVRFNPELPEIVTVCDLQNDPHERNPFAVGLGPTAPAIGATKEQLAECNAKRKRFTEPGRAVLRAIAPRRNLTVRNEGLGTPELRDTGEKIAAIEHAHREKKAAQNTFRGEIGKLSATLGVAIDPARVQQPEAVKSRLLSAAANRERILALEAGEAAGTEHNEQSQ